MTQYFNTDHEFKRTVVNIKDILVVLTRVLRTVYFLPLGTDCNLLGIKYRFEYPVIKLILQSIDLYNYIIN